MTRKEIDRQFDAIVEFAGRRAVPRHAGQALLERDVRAAGLRRGRPPRDRDPARRRGARRRRRRLPGASASARWSDLARGGRTIVLVSHNIGAIRQFTARSLLFEGGALVSAGPTGEVVEHYVSADVGAALVDTRRLQHVDRHWGAIWRIVTVTVNEGEAVLASDAPLHIDLEVETETSFEDLRVSVQITSLATGPVSHAFSRPVIDARARRQHDPRDDPRPASDGGPYTVGSRVGTGDLYGSLDNLDGLLDTAVFEVGQPVDADGRVGSWNPAWGRSSTPTSTSAVEESAPVTRSAP